MPVIQLHNGKIQKIGDFKMPPNFPKILPLAIIGVIVLVVLLLLLGMFFTVPADSNGVVLRFGKYIETVQPGLHMKMPWPIDEVMIVRTERTLTEEFGFSTSRPGQQTDYAPQTREHEDVKRMLTGDLNLVSVEWIVQYRISDASDYLFNSRDPEHDIRNVSEAIMRQVVGDSSVDEVITIARGSIAGEAKGKIQHILDNYGCGINVLECRLQAAEPPPEVKDAFDEVNRSLQQMEKMVNDAIGERNSKVPAARGERDRRIAEAEGYRDQVVQEAEGRARAFTAQLEEYRQSPQATRLRLYLETMEEVLESIPDKTLIDSNLQGVVPYLDIEELARPAIKSRGGASQ